MTAPAGAVVRIYYDGVAEIDTGHALVTTTGRTYLVVVCRRQSRGKHRGRWHLECLVTDSDPPPGATVHPLRWYRRDKRRRGQRPLAA